MINPKIFKAYDIRGIYPIDINEHNFDIIIKSIYTFFTQELKKNNLKILIGRDMRLSSPILFKIAKETLINLGASVIDAGLLSTPTFYFSILKSKADCGIQISASHNPPEWNGIKFALRINDKLIKIGKNTGMDKIKKLINSNKFINRSDKGNSVNLNNISKDEVDFAFDYVRPKLINNFKIVADPANAMGILYINELFQKTKCKLIKLNFTLDGSFPAHQPDPLDFNNLKQLQKKVIEEKADLGIAPDGDGDRVFFIDEKGQVIPASYISSLIATELLKKYKKGKIGIDIRYIRNISRAVLKAGGIPVIGHVGHALITELMNKENIIFTGESSGHYFYHVTGNGESSVITILMILDIMSREKLPISKIVSKFVTSFESGEFNFILPSEINAKSLMKDISKIFKKAKKSWLDGLSVDFDDWRFSLRSSNTEPLFRLNLEADSKSLMKIKLNMLIKILYSFGATLKK